MTYLGGVLRQHIAEDEIAEMKRCLPGGCRTARLPHEGDGPWPPHAPHQSQQLDTGPSTAPAQEQQRGRSKDHPGVWAGAAGEEDTQNMGLRPSWEDLTST